MTEIDPMQPVHPLRTTKLYPVPPVCHALWTEEDWERTAVIVTEQEVLDVPLMGRWRACARDTQGNLLYRQEA